MNTFNNWNILIVDDSKKIHEIVDNPFFEDKILGKPLNFVSAFTKEDAFGILSESHQEISVILFDIILTEGNGSDVIKYVRDELKNDKIQIIIRSDTDIDFSKAEIYDNYVIHDYIDDEDNTDGKLFFTIKSAISTFNDILKIEEQGKQLQAGINAASYIQKALFPQKKVLTKNFPESFIIHKPHQKVSGDFYYFSNILGKHIVIAADCTGHGVPASLTSMLGLSFLKRIINEDKVFDPANILTKLDQEIIKIFKHKESDGNVKDGMDISICTIDIKHKTLLFAGAKNSIIHFRGSNRYIPDVSVYPIGEHDTTSEKNFTSELIKLESGDLIYMYSDGYFGQIGGEKNKTLQKNKFVQIIDSIKKKNMNKQKELLKNELNKWKGNNKQTDDILIIGIKIP